MQRGLARARGAVAGRGRHRDHDAADQARDHAEQGTLHAGDHDHHRIAPQLFLVPQDAPQAGDADVGDLARGDAVESERADRLARDRQIAGAGGDHRDLRLAPGRRSAPQDRGARGRIVVEARLAPARRARRRPPASSRVSSSGASRACASAIASPICCGVLPAQSTASPRPIRSRRWKSKVTSGHRRRCAGKRCPCGRARSARRLASAMRSIARAQRAAARAPRCAPAAGSSWIATPSCSSRQRTVRGASSRWISRSTACTSRSRSAVTAIPVSSRLDRQGAAGSSARSSSPSARASARTLALSIPAST